MRRPSGVSSRWTRASYQRSGMPGVALELGVEHVEERERALEVEAPGAQPLGGGA